MRRRSFYASVVFYFIAPLVLAACVAALVVTGLATYENYKLGQTTDQIVRVVSLARDLKLAKDFTPERSSFLFFERLQGIMSSEVLTWPPSSEGRTQEHGVRTPSGDVLRVYFYPSSSSVRLETKISATFCRRVLLFYAKDVVSLGLRRVDARSDEIGTIWRMIYQEQGKDSHLSSDAIRAGCGTDGDDVLSLTFYL